MQSCWAHPGMWTQVTTGPGAVGKSNTVFGGNPIELKIGRDKSEGER